MWLWWRPQTKIKNMHQACTRSIFLNALNMVESRIHFSGEALKRILQNCARDSYQTMNCESGAVSGVRECASGECSKHILIFEHFRWIRICYVFHGQSATRKLCDKNSIVFIVSDCNNHTATAGFFATAYKTPAGTKNKCIRARIWRVRVLTHEYKLESLACDQHDGVRWWWTTSK